MITVFSKPACSFCVNAKNLLADRDISFNEVILDIGQEKAPDARYMPINEFKEKFPTVRTLPHIIDEDVVIGGFKELKRMLDIAA